MIAEPQGRESNSFIHLLAWFAVCLGADIHSPHMFHDHAARHNGSPVPQEVAEQHEFFAGEVYLFIAALDYLLFVSTTKSLIFSTSLGISWGRRSRARILARSSLTQKGLGT